MSPPGARREATHLITREEFVFDILASDGSLIAWVTSGSLEKEERAWVVITGYQPCAGGPPVLCHTWCQTQMLAFKFIINPSNIYFLEVFSHELLGFIVIKNSICQYKWNILNILCFWYLRIRHSCSWHIKNLPARLGRKVQRTFNSSH